jgi:5'-deoxynucleotidase YfbR-like HD superfamily hydrolase
VSRFLPLEPLLELARVSLLLGRTFRVTMHPDGSFESVATHSIMLALVAGEVAGRLGYDEGLVYRYAVIHDLAECYAGDTNTARGLTPEQAEEKARREALATNRLEEELAASAEVLDLLAAYEEQDEPEAQLVRFVDKILPKLVHVLAGGRALEAMGMSFDEVLESHASQGAREGARYGEELPEVLDLFWRACQLAERELEGKLRGSEGPQDEPEARQAPRGPRLALRPGLEPDTAPDSPSGATWRYLALSEDIGPGGGETPLARCTVALLYKRSSEAGGGWGADIRGYDGGAHCRRILPDGHSPAGPNTREQLEEQLEALLVEDGWQLFDDPRRPRSAGGPE